MRVPVLNESSTLRYFTFFYLYIMQGIPAGFALTAISNYLLGKHIEPYRVGTFIAFVGLPWTLQFVWGPLIDRYQYSVIGHRKHWVLLSQLAAIIVSLALLGIKDLQNQIPMLSLVFCIHSVFASIQVASVDAMAISIAPINERGKLNGFMRGGFLLGIAFGSAVLSFVLHTFSFRSAALLQTLALSIFSIMFFFTKLDRRDLLLPLLWNNKKQQIAEAANPDLRLVFKKVYLGITSQKSLRYFSVVALVYFCSSVFIRSFTYHLINVLKWSDKSVSLLQGSWGSAITFVAILIAGAASDKIGAKRMQVKVMWGVCFFLILLNCFSRFWHYDVFSGGALILWNLADPLLSVTIFPILMGLCWEKVEGSQFTSYLALINLCDVTGSYITGWCLGSISAPVLGFSCGIIMLITLLVLKMNKNYSIIPG